MHHWSNIIICPLLVKALNLADILHKFFVWNWWIKSQSGSTSKWEPKWSWTGCQGEKGGATKSVLQIQFNCVCVCNIIFAATRLHLRVCQVFILSMFHIYLQCDTYHHMWHNFGPGTNYYKIVCSYHKKLLRACERRCGFPLPSHPNESLIQQLLNRHLLGWSCWWFLMS